MSALHDGIAEILAGPQGAQLLEGATLRIQPATADLVDKTGRLLWRGPIEFVQVPLGSQLEKRLADILAL